MFKLINFPHFNFVNSNLGIDFDSWFYNIALLFVIFVDLHKTVKGYGQIIFGIKILKGLQVHNGTIILLYSLYLIKSHDSIIVNKRIKVELAASILCVLTDVVGANDHCFVMLVVEYLLGDLPTFETQSIRYFHSCFVVY